MTRYKAMIFALIASFIIVIMGACLKITHAEGADNIMLAGGIVYIVALVLAIYEVMSSPRIGIGQKLLWLICFLFLGMIGMFIYLLLGRKNVVDNNATATATV